MELRSGAIRALARNAESGEDEKITNQDPKHPAAEANDRSTDESSALPFRQD